MRLARPVYESLPLVYMLLGGLAFLIGWLCLGLAAWRLQPT